MSDTKNTAICKAIEQIEFMQWFLKDDSNFLDRFLQQVGDEVEINYDKIISMVVKLINKNFQLQLDDNSKIIDWIGQILLSDAVSGDFFYFDVAREYRQSSNENIIARFDHDYETVALEIPLPEKKDRDYIKKTTKCHVSFDGKLIHIPYPFNIVIRLRTDELLKDFRQIMRELS